ncbi:hypothetical protein LTR12_006730 [Friedmanniomyces endolithicus]|nr:hypothetical protein LTR12_006730 [Friedmanniomyces endolithicus]
MIFLKTLATVALLPLLVLSQSAALSSYGALPTIITGNGSAVRPDGKYVISSEGITGYFIPYGASISNLFIQDVHGVERDIVLGFDNATYYSETRLHPHLNGIPGRYANRIKNSTFEIDGVTYHTDPNDNNKNDTLHGGSNGWDYRNWTVEAHTTDSITFSLVDPDGSLGMGFPGEVLAYITYTLTPYQWHLRMTALSTTKKTPIMLSSHTYWNLDGFQNPTTPSALNYSLFLPYAGLRTEIDNIEVPTGNLLGNKQGSVNDWWSAPKQLGANITSPALLGNCGYNCTGYGTLALKETQGFFNDSSRPRVAKKYGCVVMEVEDWIDGINHPEWGRSGRQVFGPGDGPYVLEARYAFSLNRSLAAGFNETG